MNQRWREAVQTGQGVQSKYKQLVKAIASDIESAALPSGMRLPPQREVAADLKISVQTVTNAYKELERHGLIRCEVGRGSFVSARVTEAMSSYMLDKDERSVVDFSIARIVHTREHDAMWRKVCASFSTIEEQPWIRACRPIAGFEHHRQAGVAWLAALNMPARADTLLVTNGAAHGIFLALASVVGPGDTVLCESLTDHGVIGLANVLGFTLKGLDIDEHGIRPDHFEEICNSERVSALVCTPTLNNPTVALMPDSRRRAIAHIAERYGVNVIEDDVHGALPAKAQTPIASLIPELAFYCTSMTKSVLSGLRTGYLTMPRRLALRAESILRVSSWMASAPMAEIATRWIMDGTAQRLVAIQRERLAARQAVVREVLGAYVLGGHPHALSVWLRVPDNWQVDLITRELRRRRIALTLPDPFVVHGARKPKAVRLCVGAEISDSSFKAAVETIREVFEQYPHVHDFS
ncbi:MocR-like ectoine utilization transcription factor EhuR [Verminephrobacter eiseniae]|uniref:MocR-like ectoine utilization transcription factor EhuR n=1 Tax=Verminephrobacter eiseniae TaxID=364317 RepID=UPI0010D268F6|nr:PLP-dependent aminotransferase family protein [Verminephrobacter eiseniae]KAB7619662.1 PLP-dependent aminotransferase family protein [Verminephrobacter sp. Larva24]MCW5229957.1 PLP-dependent aminotransferase family protein [Verminephrobacter eiseniae]MCW5291689.1 PLP-dependent aminotransferase family protein [Verminephrobacter eiseniae]MCW8183422.1 PLP-dependent aminotransferase family protein [Verminephrobacter eiseniae]MCW8221689.1 PLP-dependent aminotransferase family protein [Verminephr